MENVGMKAAVQVFQQTEELKSRLGSASDIFGNNEVWSYHHDLQRLYRRLLLMDLEFALDKKVEQDLWNCIFKNQITILQNQAKDKKNVKRGEANSTLHWFLESTSGFYFQLLQEMCLAFELDLPFCRKGNTCGVSGDTNEGVVQPHKSSCYYICQHILVHLGDIARYQNQPSHAQTFYRHAVSLVPTSGHPYNQLALLEAGRGDKLSTVYYYVRSIAVRNPFPVAKTNLGQILTRVLSDEVCVDLSSRLVGEGEFLCGFLQFHALLHTGTDFVAAASLSKTLCEALTSLVATEALSAWRMVQMIAITLWVYQEKNDVEEVSSLCSDLLAALLNSVLLPAYTRKHHQNPMEEYYALPAVKVLLDWIRGDVSILQKNAFVSRPHIWPSLCQLLNSLNPGELSDYSHYTDAALPEDRDLQGFLPLQKVLRAFKVREAHGTAPEDVCRKLRAARILSLGRWLTKQSVLTINDEGVFQPVNQQAPSSDVLKQLEEWSRNKEKMDKVIETIPQVLIKDCPPVPRGLTPEEISLAATQKRPGILKPNSTEVLSGGTPNGTTNSKPSRLLSAPLPTRKARQNVAINTIMKKSTLVPEIKGELKQVTFKTPSPSISPCSSGGSQPEYQQNHKQQQISPNCRPTTIHPQPQSYANQQRVKNLPPRLAAQYGQLPSPPKETNNSYGPPGGELKPTYNHYQNRGSQFPIGSGYMLPAQRTIPTTQPDTSRPPGPWWSDGQDGIANQGDRSPSNMLSIMSGPGFPRLTDFKPPIMGLPGSSPPQPTPKPETPATPPMFNPFVPPPSHPPNLTQLLNQLQHRTQDNEAFPPPVPTFQQPPTGFQEHTEPPELFENRGFPGMDSRRSPMDGLAKTYSLFSNPGPSWTTSVGQRNDTEPRVPVPTLPSQPAHSLQSLWSGPGPSPLERLLEQQKQKREGLPNS